MALTVSNVATATSIVAGGTLVVTGVTAAIGDMLVLACAADNAGASGVPSLSTTVTDSAGNTWVNRGGLINRTAGATDDGTTLGLWTCLVTATLTAGTVTLSFSPNTTSKAATIKKAVASTGQVPTVLSVGAGGSGAASTWTSGIIPGVIVGHAVFAYSAIEGRGNADADVDTTNGSWAARQGAIADTTVILTSQVITGQHKIVTATGDQTFDSGSGGASRDYAWNWLIIYPHPEIFGPLVATDTPDVGAFSAVGTNFGTMAATDTPDVGAISGTVSPPSANSLRILVRIDWASGPTVTTRLWDGGGPWVDNDGDIWLGAGALGNLDEIEQAINGEAAEINLTLAGVGPEESGLVWQSYTNDQIIGSTVQILIQPCDGRDQPIGEPEVRFTGTMDDIDFLDSVADDRRVSTISTPVVNKFTVRRVKSGAVLSDADQKARSAILNPAGDPDRFCERVPLLADRTITWPRWN